MKNPFDPQSYPLLVLARLGLALTLGGLAVLALIGLVSASSPADTQANVPAPGDLDAGFGVGGIVTTPIGSSNDTAYGVAIQEDGRIVVGGCQQVGSFGDFALARYTASGELDASFGIGGITTTHVATYWDCANDLALQQDGKIVAAGYAYFHGPAGGYNDFAVVRYTDDGALDSTFGMGGIVTTSVAYARDDEAKGVAIQPDGKIVLVGSYLTDDYDRKIAVVRYTVSGALDDTFGVGGIVTASIGSYDDYAYSVAVQNDGKIVVAGSTTGNAFMDTVVLRYTTSGALDATFGNGGIITTSVSLREDQAFDVVIQDDGKIVVAGQAYFDSGGYHFALLRYTVFGTPDATFGNGGVVTTAIGLSGDAVEDLAIQPDGKILAAGYSHTPLGYNFAVARYTAGGVLDSSFGAGGIVTTSLSLGSDYARAVALQRDGKIVVAGHAHNGSDHDFAVVRYHGWYNVYLPLVLRNK